jgi:hypothetical protein
MCVTTSSIKVALQGAKFNETLGELFLSNIFDQNPDQQNFIGVSLSRTDSRAPRTRHSSSTRWAMTTRMSCLRLPSRFSPGNKGRCSRTCLVLDMLIPKASNALVEVVLNLLHSSRDQVGDLNASWRPEAGEEREAVIFVIQSTSCSLTKNEKLTEVACS